jgi:hypothetical protein
MTNDEVREFVLECTLANAYTSKEIIQSLWSGYGKIERWRLSGSEYKQVITKQVIPEVGDHPRGWNTDLSHQRKLKSYQVETNWYESIRNRDEPLLARVPHCLGIKKEGDQVLLVLEDLDGSGFAGRRNLANQNEWQTCVRWLASFHLENMNQSTEGLWESGTYWHLQTRPDELARLDDANLREAAPKIDLKLKDTKYQTLVHGDAKLANFCFNQEGTEVAAVDFQYIGGGCGMKDLAYFVGSCFREEEAERIEKEVVDFYFSGMRELNQKLGAPIYVDQLEMDWRPLYRVAWADFHRFMKGWSPGHWKLSDYSERVTREVIESLLV